MSEEEKNKCIINDLENYLLKKIKEKGFICYDYNVYFTEEANKFKQVLDKIQELKEKYK